MMADQHWRLSDLTTEIHRTIRDGFAGRTFWVMADVTSHTYRPERRNHFFELVEKDARSGNILAKLTGKAWGTGSDAIEKFEMATGQKFMSNIAALMSVEVQYHELYGLQINLVDIDINFTLGALEQQRRKTLQQLVTQNPGVIWLAGDKYYTRNNQLPLNKIIQRIAVIASTTSAGAEDLRHTLINNPYAYLFSIDEYPAPVQGDNFATDMIQQLIAIYHSNINYDAVIITRGGGSQADFVLFDNYELARAIARFPVPVFTGIGHQRNESIADLMAHTSAKTPTKAAELMIAHNRAAEEEILLFQQSIIIRAQQQLGLASKQLVEKTNAVLSTPKTILNNQKNNLDNIMSNIKTFNHQLIKNQYTSIDHYDSLIKVMSPLNILKKGFAIIKSKEKIITDFSEINTGDELTVLTSTATLTTTVNQKTIQDATDNDL